MRGLTAIRPSLPLALLVLGTACGRVSPDPETGVACDPDVSDERPLQGILRLDNCLDGQWTLVQPSFYAMGDFKLSYTELQVTAEAAECSVWAALSASGDYEELLAGELTISFGDEQLSMEPGLWYEPNDGVPRYNMDQTLEEAGYAPMWGELYGFSATGAGYPPFDYQPAVRFPAAPMVVTSPDIGTSVDPVFSWPGPVPLEWDGASDADRVLVEITVYADDYYLIRCETEDDGAYEIPVGVLDLLPSSVTLNIEVIRYQESCHEPDSDSWLTVRAQTRNGGQVKLD